MTRSFSVQASSNTSQPLPLSYGFPQGLGPLLFILYTAPLSHLIESSSVDHHLYADDTQRFISSLFLQPHLQSLPPRPLFLPQLQSCSVVNHIFQWMSSNFLCLNPSKTEFIIIGLSAQIKKIPDPSILLSNNFFHYFHLWCSCSQSWCNFWTSSLFLQPHLQSLPLLLYTHTSEVFNYIWPGAKSITNRRGGGP